MKLTVERSALADLMSRGGSSAARLSTIPILTHARLIARDEALHVSSTDLDIQADAGASAAVEVPGGVTVNAKALADFVSKLPTNVKTLSIEADPAGGALVVKSGRNRARIPTLPVGDFPDLNVVKGERGESFKLSGADVETLFARTTIAASTEETRFYLRGVYLEATGGELRATATNGHILLRLAIPLPVGAAMPKGGTNRGVIVPTEAARLALKLFGREAEVSVTVSTRGIIFEAGSTRITSKLVDGSFPDCDRVIPEIVPTQIKLDRASCLSAIGLIEVFQSKDSGKALECGEDPEGLALAAGGRGDGDGFAVAMADFEGAVPNFGVSSQYLRDVLGAFKDDVVTISIENAGSPIRLFDQNDTSVTGVVMPMRISTALLRREAEQ